MIDLTEHEFGVLLRVRAQPGSRRNEIRGEQNGALKVSVTQIAEKGKANQALIKQLCKSLKLRRSQIELVAGELSTDKRFLIRDVSMEDLQSVLESFIA